MCGLDIFVSWTLTRPKFHLQPAPLNRNPFHSTVITVLRGLKIQFTVIILFFGGQLYNRYQILTSSWSSATGDLTGTGNGRLSSSDKFICLVPFGDFGETGVGGGKVSCLRVSFSKTR